MCVCERQTEIISQLNEMRHMAAIDHEQKFDESMEIYYHGESTKNIEHLILVVHTSNGCERTYTMKFG